MFGYGVDACLKKEYEPSAMAHFRYSNSTLMSKKNHIVQRYTVYFSQLLNRPSQADDQQAIQYNP